MEIVDGSVLQYIPQGIALGARAAMPGMTHAEDQASFRPHPGAMTRVGTIGERSSAEGPT